MKTKKQKTPRKEGTAIIDVAIDRAFRIISMSGGKTCMAYLHDVEEIGIYIEMLESERKKKKQKKEKGPDPAGEPGRKVISYQEGDCNSIAASENTLRQVHRGYC